MEVDLMKLKEIAISVALAAMLGVVGLIGVPALINNINRQNLIDFVTSLSTMMSMESSPEMTVEVRNGTGSGTFTFPYANLAPYSDAVADATGTAAATAVAPWDTTAGAATAGNTDRYFVGSSDIQGWYGFRISNNYSELQIFTGPGANNGSSLGRPVAVGTTRFRLGGLDTDWFSFNDTATLPEGSGPSLMDISRGNSYLPAIMENYDQETLQLALALDFLSMRSSSLDELILDNPSTAFGASPTYVIPGTTAPLKTPVAIDATSNTFKLQFLQHILGVRNGRGGLMKTSDITSAGDVPLVGVVIADPAKMANTIDAGNLNRYRDYKFFIVKYVASAETIRNSMSQFLFAKPYTDTTIKTEEKNVIEEVVTGIRNLVVNDVLLTPINEDGLFRDNNGVYVVSNAVPVEWQ
jgi:hypothetical protein